MFPKSSRWRVFQNDSCPSLRNQPIFIEAQKVETRCRPRPLHDFGAKMTSCDTILARPLTTSSISDNFLSPLIKLIITDSNFLQYDLGGVGRTVALRLNVLREALFKLIIRSTSMFPKPHSRAHGLMGSLTDG